MLQEKNATLPIKYRKEDFIVTPRIPILVPSKNMEEILHSARSNKIEISRWFIESPLHLTYLTILINLLL